VIKEDRSAWCVGYNGENQLKHDGTGGIVLTADRFDADTARTIATGKYTACFVSCTDGKTRCAGHGTEGQLGNGADATSSALVIATGLDSGVCPIIK
jgi:alpha-tubulin suppressor-like RCC1 family protein